MWIKSVLTEELSFAKIEGVSKKRVINQLAEVFAQEFDDIDASTLFMNLINREKLGSTGIGEGIAIPHCRFATGGRTLCACLTLAKPIDFDSVDHQPVDVVFAMIVPENSEENHLQRLAALAEALLNKDFVTNVRNATTSEALYKAVAQV